MNRDDNCFLRAKVNRSQATTEKPHEAWICVNKQNGTVLNAHCTCMAGMGEVCSHVAAILFKVEASVRLGYNKVSCTSMPCQWNQNFTKKVEASPLSEINFKKPKKSTFHLPSTAMQIQPKMNFDNTGTFLEKLKETNPTAVIFSVINPQPNPPIPSPSLPSVLTSLYDEHYVNLSNSDLETKCSELVKNIKVTVDEASNLERLTRQQSFSIHWHSHRKGRLTASNFYDICHTNPQQPSISLMRRIMMYSTSFDTAAIRWGKSKEDTALREYEAEMRKHNPAFVVKKSGLVLHPDHPTLGASPDGVTECPCCGRGLVEIKCPFKFVNSHPCYVSENGFYLEKHDSRTCTIKDGLNLCDIKLKQSSRYFYQVQGQIAMCDVAFCDFVCWTPNGMHIERVKRDDAFFRDILEKLHQFFRKSVLPELLTNRLSSDVNNNMRQVDTTVCICGKQEYFDNLIGCDSGQCSVEWFHMKCVGLKNAPQGSWKCLTCRKLPPSKRRRQ